MDRAISRAHRTKRSASGLSVRRLTVMMPAAVRSVDAFIGKILRDNRRALKRRTDAGSNPTY